MGYLSRAARGGRGRANHAARAAGLRPHHRAPNDGGGAGLLDPHASVPTYYLRLSVSAMPMPQFFRPLFVSRALSRLASARPVRPASFDLLPARFKRVDPPPRHGTPSAPAGTASTATS